MLHLLFALLITAHADQAPKALYVVSGPCYGGEAQTTLSPANLISKFDPQTGVMLGHVYDFNQMYGDQPVAAADWDDTHLLVGIDNGNNHRLDLVAKDGSGTTNYISSPYLNQPFRALEVLPDRSLLVARQNAIEKFSAGKARISVGANPFIFAPGGACGVVPRAYAAIAVSNSGKILLAGIAAKPGNLVTVIAPQGYRAAADCLSATQAPTDVSIPTALAFHPSGDLLVAFGSNVADSNLVMSYQYDDSTGLTSNPNVAWSNTGVIYAPSAMVVDSQSGDVFIASSQVQYLTIEKFHYDSTNRTLEKVGVFPLIGSSIETRCVSSMLIAN